MGIRPYKKRLKDLHGKKVYSFRGTYLGQVSVADDKTIEVHKKLLGIGLGFKKLKIANNDIDKIENSVITLRPHHYDYWQFPTDDVEYYESKYFTVRI